MIELPEKFKERMRLELSEEYDRFIASYDRPPYKGIRVNTLKITAERFKEISPFALEQIAWEKDGFYIKEEKAGKTVMHAAGLYYVQEPSAMCAAPLLNVAEGERVLDLCSAPGGKGTQLAQKMRGKGVIVLNEVNLSRAKILSQNVERLGITNAAVISESPERIAAHFGGYFDKVLVDAPCSGEGMFLKEEAAVREWSPANVEACARRQTAILDCAQKVVKPNGLLVYSTCTFAEQEDEKQVENFLVKYPDFQLVSMKKLFPHECAGEGHFAALFKKLDGEECEAPPFKLTVPDKKTLAIYRQFEKQTLKGVSFQNLHFAGGMLYSIMGECPALPFNTLRAGVRLCEVRTGRVEPCHALAMCLKSQEVAALEVEREKAVAYLGGNTFNLQENISGWAVVTHGGYPLGWCKAVDGVAKNHLPKGLRI